MSQEIIDQLTARNQDLEGKLKVATELSKNLDETVTKYESMDVEGMAARLESFEALGSVEELQAKMESLAKYESIDTPDDIKSLIDKAAEILTGIDEEFGTPDVIRDKFEELNTTIQDLQTKVAEAQAQLEQKDATIAEQDEVMEKAESIISKMESYWGTEEKMTATFESIKKQEHEALVNRLATEGKITTDQAEQALGKFESYDEALSFVKLLAPNGTANRGPQPKHESKVPLIPADEKHKEKPDASRSRGLRDLVRRLH